MRVAKQLISLVFLWFMSTSIQAEQSPVQAETEDTLEIIHTWGLASYHDATEVIRNASTLPLLTRHAYLWESREYLSERVAQGFPPASAQWLPGPELDSMAELGVLHGLNAIAHKQSWHSKLNQYVLNSTRYKGQYWAMPLNMHFQNLFWYSKTLFEQLNLAVPTTWKEFVDTAQILQEKGYVPAITIDNKTSKSIIWQTILLSMLSTDDYQKLFLNQLSEQQSLALLQDAFFQLEQVIPYIASFRLNAMNFPAQLQEHKAAMWLTGDWAKPQFDALSMRLGIDYDCSLSPGNQDKSLLTIQSMIFPRGAPVSLERIEKHFIQPVLTPETQLLFAEKKGTLPVLNNIDVSQLNKCGQMLWRVSEKRNYAQTLKMFSGDVFSLLVENTLHDFWYKRLTVQQAAATIYQEISKIPALTANK